MRASYCSCDHLHYRLTFLLSYCASIFSQTFNMERAKALVREMEEEGIDAPIDIYHTMMDGYTMIGNEEKCLIVFERLKVKARLLCFL